MSATKYTEEHEWLKIDDHGLVTVGITDFAQDHLGDLVYVQLPDIGKEIEKGQEAAVIESVKTASEIMMPASGVITEVNEALAEEPGKVNEDPLGEGWFFRFQANDVAGITGLMDEDGYKAFLATLG
ncbi:glycine cleavage system protein GcvH [Glaciimonas sp. PAMC28666]|uniref:glycine cleavage system protein GcvH n=1 Tax=Glaciimonas sp. PAMC28666 TaxID=2807626 RepID=UPI0019634EB3|nr:glycine cleavage system protein GcvH [Glaciimonas sp. PAMC28666]QRX82623.1 glycine cleavage system protein GcvH [Glaciimonas sp. PAMC28666]